MNPEAHEAYLRGRHEWSRYTEEGFRQALRYFERALEIDPQFTPAHAGLSPSVAAMSLWPLYEGRRYDAAIAEAEKLLRLAPEQWPPRFILAQALMQRGETSRSVKEFETVARREATNPTLVAWLGWAYGRAGRRSEAEKVLAELASPAPGRFVQPYAHALVLVGLGRKDEALTWLEAGVRDRTEEVIFLKVEPATRRDWTTCCWSWGGRPRRLAVPGTCGAQPPPGKADVLANDHDLAERDRAFPREAREV